MQLIDDPGDALAVLHDPGFVVPPVPAATHGVAWLRAGVGRFSVGGAHTRRRAISESLLSTVDPAELRAAAASSPDSHPVQLLCTALGLPSSDGTAVDLVRAVAVAYQPGTGDETAADDAVRLLVDAFGGTPDEVTAARIGLLVQACEATTTLIDRAREAAAVDGADTREAVAASRGQAAAGLEAVLRDAPPVRATKRMATRPVDLGGTRVEAGEVVRVSLHGIPFGAGPRRCPGRDHALAIVEGALGLSAGEGGDAAGVPGTAEGAVSAGDGGGGDVR